MFRIKVKDYSNSLNDKVQNELVKEQQRVLSISQTCYNNYSFNSRIY